MKTIRLLTVFLLTSPTLLAQPYVSGGNTRHRFAQMYLGLDAQVVAAGGRFTYRGGDAQLLTGTVPTQLRPRLTIGALHFWGHADLYVTFPVGSNLTRRPDGEPTASYDTGIETGVRVYPWRLESGRVRPFLGAAFTTSTFRQFTAGQQPDAPSFSRSLLPLQAGLTFAARRNLIEAGVAYRTNPSFNYYIDRTTAARVSAPSMWFWLGIKRYFDTTLPAEKEYAATRRLEQRMTKHHRLSGLSVAAGPSAAFFTRQSAYNAETRPYLQPYSANVFPEFGIGYYYQPKEIHINLAYRQNQSDKAGFGVQQSLGRRSVALEAYRFLGDYHGFVPFIGPCLSLERLTVNETDNVAHTNLTRTNTAIKPGITFGWDIRPTKLESIVLRTNLRYTPNLNVSMPTGKTVAFDQIEFNFIQAVWYPGLRKNIRREARDSRNEQPVP